MQFLYLLGPQHIRHSLMHQSIPQSVPPFSIVSDATPRGSRQGLAPVPFHRIVQVFGPPRQPNYLYGVTVLEWNIRFADGTEARIYDYKATSLYDEDLPHPSALTHNTPGHAPFTEWHVGGTTPNALRLVLLALCTIEPDVIDLATYRKGKLAAVHSQP